LASISFASLDGVDMGALTAPLIRHTVAEVDVALLHPVLHPNHARRAVLRVGPLSSA
jgi:hypothetical protein